jgi:hypothetical protein
MKRALAVLVVALLASVVAEAGLLQNGMKTFSVQGEVDSGSSTVIDGDAQANVTIQSPENRVYGVNNITVAFTIETEVLLGGKNWTGTLFDPILTYGCALDSDTTGLVEAYTDSAWWPGPGWVWNPLKPGVVPDSNVDVVLSRYENGYFGNATLTGLSQGSHNLTVLVRTELSYISYGVYSGAVLSTVLFNVDLVPLNISFLSPEAKVYGSVSVPLNLTVNEAPSVLKYSLDGQANVTLAGNATLIDLSNGDHNVTVYGVDRFGNPGTFETVRFSIEPFPTTLVAVAIIASAAAVSFGLVAYFLRRKERRAA